MSKIRKRRRRRLASCPQNLQDLSSLYSPSFFRNSIFYASRPRPDSSRVLFSSSRYERPTHAYVHTYRRTYTYVHAFARRFPISFNNVSRKSIIVFRRWLSPLSLFLSFSHAITGARLSSLFDTLIVRSYTCFNESQTNRTRIFRPFHKFLILRRGT